MDTASVLSVTWRKEALLRGELKNENQHTINNPLESVAIIVLAAVADNEVYDHSIFPLVEFVLPKEKETGELCETWMAIPSALSTFVRWALEAGVLDEGDWFAILAKGKKPLFGRVQKDIASGYVVTRRNELLECVMEERGLL